MCVLIAGGRWRPPQQSAKRESCRTTQSSTCPSRCPSTTTRHAPSYRSYITCSNNNDNNSNLKKNLQFLSAPFPFKNLHYILLSQWVVFFNRPISEWSTFLAIFISFSKFLNSGAKGCNVFLHNLRNLTGPKASRI